MIRRSTFSFIALSTLLAAAPSISGCSGADADAELGSSDEGLTVAIAGQQALFADPTKGLVGRGFNRRAPLSRLYFVPGTIRDGGWAEAAATDRAQCVEFSGGVVAPSSTAITTRSRILMVDSKQKFLASASLDGAQSGDANVLLPIEGLPVPASGSTNRTISSEFQTELHSDRVNIGVITTAALTETLRASGNATIRSAVVNDVLAQPAAARRSAFFAKCGDRYLDNLTMGGAVAIDVSFAFKRGSVDGKFKAMVNDTLALGSSGERRADTATGPVDATGALANLLRVLNISTSNAINTASAFSYGDRQGEMTISVRTLGPNVDTSTMTIQGALDLAGAVASRVQNAPWERAVLSAVQKTYATTTNASQLSGALPGEIDLIYPTYMAAIRENFAAHYAALNTFTTIERDMNFVPSTEWSTTWYDALPGIPAVKAARQAALTFAGANAQAMECLASVPPGSPQSAFTACLTQGITGDTTSGTLARKFPRLVANLAPFGTSIVDLMSVGQGLGIYPSIPRRRVTFAITATYGEFFAPMNAAGVTSPVTYREDKLPDACRTASVSGKVVFQSGPADDGDWLTGSRCDWSAFQGIATRTRPTWSIRGRYEKIDVGANAGAYRTAPGNFSTVLGPIAGRIAAEKWLATSSGVMLAEVSATGPLDMTPNNLNLVSGPIDVRLALNPNP